ncbi:MAG: GNAT family N-acetyltransferase [Clostridia bacterium]|nr:GNAT family N-acetyltransferase [Clostridia bacterium]
MALPIREKTQIKTERLILKPYSEQDMDALIDLLTDPEITSTFMVPEMGSRSCAEELVKKLIGFSQPDDTKHLEYGIYLGEKMIGFVNDCGVEEDEIEIGYVIHPQYQGHGYATETVHTVLAELCEMGFRKVTAGYFAENTASLRVMEKCGMQRTTITEEEDYRGKRHLCRYCEICF